MHREDNPGREEILRGVTAWLESEHDIELLAPLGFENAYALAMTKQRADALGIRTIDDLARHAPQLKMGGDYEFFGRPEWRELAAQYDLRFQQLVTMDSTLMYAAVEVGEVDVITAFSSDGRISAFDLTTPSNSMSTSRDPRRKRIRIRSSPVVTSSRNPPDASVRVVAAEPSTLTSMPARELDPE
jgi:glycine betaine/choline ABC-type transport system substrate-binding protein